MGDISKEYNRSGLSFIWKSYAKQTFLRRFALELVEPSSIKKHFLGPEVRRVDKEPNDMS